ncbi:MAG: hopanoid biosynthesis-associated protein HpnK, partial [bacterium]|nr:hopanoid biosynthesis-associated protein HpnK [bacterium]
MKRLIITADDFGLCREVNEAVVRAHTRGILTCASLMMGEEATDEAIGLAKANAALKIGLHLTLVEGRSVLPHEKIPNLVDKEGRFSNAIVWSGIRYFFSRKIQKQIEMECQAQIEKFLATGLKMDHLNSHNHLHIHPSILKIVVKLAKEYGIKAVRLPWVLRTRRVLDKADIYHNDMIFGLSESGKMNLQAWERIIPKLDKGITEIYCHPATATTGILQKTMPNYRHVEELKALMDPKLKELLKKY